MGKNEVLEHLAMCAKNGDEDSFVKLCDIMKQPLFRAAKGILGNDEPALEAVSEAVFRAYKGIKKLKHLEYVATWFTRILINATHDAGKRQNFKRLHQIEL